MLNFQYSKKHKWGAEKFSVRIRDPPQQNSDVWSAYMKRARPRTFQQPLATKIVAYIYFKDKKRKKFISIKKMHFNQQKTNPKTKVNE